VGGHLEYYEEDEEQDWARSNLACSASFCTDHISYGEEVAMIAIETAAPTPEGSVEFNSILADDGDYLYEPCFMCGCCWQSVLEDLQDLFRDRPPVADAYEIVKCAVCDSSIRAGEIFGRVTLGEVSVSQRTPDGEGTSTFSPYSNKIPIVICASCMNVLNTDISELWGERVQQYNECEEGTSLRCWRHGCSADVDHHCICGNRGNNGK